MARRSGPSLSESRGVRHAALLYVTPQPMKLPLLRFSASASAVAGVVALLLLGACRFSNDHPTTEQTITVYDAGSLAVPLRAVLDSFAARSAKDGITLHIEQENAGSLETARKLTELGRVPDVIALADVDIFPSLLIPRYVDQYTPFARNRMVLLYTDRSRHAAELSPENWTDIVTRSDVEVGRSDPNLDPAGYRALLSFQLAERWYKRPGLAATLLQHAPRRNVRPKSADLVALLQTGNLDYAWGYESVARVAHLRYLSLPSAIDLSAPSERSRYATAAVRVAGATPSDSVLVHGAPILFGIAASRGAPHGDIGSRFVKFVMSPEGITILRAHALDAGQWATSADTLQGGASHTGR